MNANTLKAAVLKATVKQNEKPVISCKKALRLAEEFHVTSKRIGSLCDKEGIKIRQCLLGCF